jgi:hypothetical protein
MSYLRYLCLLECGGVQHILRCVLVLFVFLPLASCVPNVASFSGLSLFYCTFGIL